MDSKKRLKREMRTDSAMSKRTRRAIIFSACIIALVAASYFLYNECTYGGGMPGWYRDCTCIGIERLDYDQTAIDGRRRTVCIGVVAARTCYQYQGGPAIPCDSIPLK